MADNTQVNSGTGDVIRDIDRAGSGIKTQVNQIDMGGDATNAEALLSKFAPMPVADVSETEDLSNGELLTQILHEIRITNQYLYAMARGIIILDEPAIFRGDPDFFNSHED